MSSLLAAPVTATSLAGVWRLVEVNSLPMQETPPYGQVNRKEIYTEDGELLVCRPDFAATEAESMGRYEVDDDGLRIFHSAEGQRLVTPIQWIDADHFCLEFNPGEGWYYARVTGEHARDEQWEPRSVAVIRTTEDGSGPTLRDFPYDATDDSSLPWSQRVLGAWETIRVSGRGVSGPDLPPYGMPNDRLLLGADSTLRRVQANGETEANAEPLRFKVQGNQLVFLDTGMVIHFWFNHWGQLVFEQEGLQTAFKRISRDARKAPAGPFVVVLLSGEREEPKFTGGKMIEVQKSDAARATLPFPGTAPAGAPRVVARPKVTFLQPFNGGSQPADLALARTNEALLPTHAVNLQARRDGLGATSAILETNEEGKFSVIRADAIDSSFQVPFGWHVSDNGDRMLVFDPDHFTGLSLVKQRFVPGPKALLEQMLAEKRVAQPSIKSQLMDNAGGSFLLILQNDQQGDEVKTRSFLTHDIGLAGEFILVEMTASPADLMRVLNLAEVLVRNLQHAP